MGKSRRKVVTVKPVNTESDWNEMCARKVKLAQSKKLSQELNENVGMKYISEKSESSWNNHGPCLLCQTNQTKSLQVHFKRQKRDFGCVTICQIITKVHKSDCFRHGYFWLLIVILTFWPKTQEGLTVVDVYTEWSGPCTAMQATLKRAKLEVSILFFDVVMTWWGSNNKVLVISYADAMSCKSHKNWRLAMIAFNMSWLVQTLFPPFTCSGGVLPSKKRIQF